MNTLELINLGSNILKAKKIASYKLDSEILLSNVLQKSREKLIINLNKKVDSGQIIKFNKLIHRRSLNEPIAYITKQKEFWSKKFKVSRNTLIPRPETELMIEELLKIYKKNKKSIFILDIGTGSGCILLSILDELKNARGVGVDISKKALIVAKENAKKLRLVENIRFYNKCFNKIFNLKFDLIVSNPPYIKKISINNLDTDIKRFEPRVALDGGNDGLDVIQKVIYKSKEILKNNGRLALEIGNGQFKKVFELLKKNNFKTEKIIKDYKDNVRCLIATLYR